VKETIIHANTLHRTRARAIAALRRVSEPLLELLYAGNWPATLAYASGFQRSVSTLHHTLHSAYHPPHAPPLRMAFAADFHAGATTHPSTLIAACAALEAIRPDVLLFGGDFISLHARHIIPLAPRLGQIPAPFGRFAVLGNHDRWADSALIVHHLEAAGVRVLINHHYQLPPPFEHIWICGLDDVGTGKPEPKQVFAGADGIRIVLMHSPDGLRDLEQHRFDLALCGHTHGGQIALPSGIPLLLPSGALCRNYPAGRFVVKSEAESGTLIVSRGVGYSTIPLRINAAPDILAITLAASQATP
jgi:uncharacterized protein